MDVAAFRWRRQTTRTTTAAGTQHGWRLNHGRWISRDTHPAVVRGVCPAFASVERRADAEFQRRHKLAAEDVLLRSILLPEPLPVGYEIDDDDDDDDISIINA